MDALASPPHSLNIRSLDYACRPHCMCRYICFPDYIASQFISAAQIVILSCF